MTAYLEAKRLDLLLKLLLVGDDKLEVGAHKVLGHLQNLVADVLSVLERDKERD